MKKNTNDTNGSSLHNGTNSSSPIVGISTTTTATGNTGDLIFASTSPRWAPDPITHKPEKTKIFCKKCDDKIAEFYVVNDQSLIYSLKDSLCVKCHNIENVKK